MALPIKTLQDKDNTDFQPKVDAPLVMMPNQASRTTYTWETQFTADKDGWLIAWSNERNTGASILTVNSVEVLKKNINYGDNSQFITMGPYPIKSGDEFKASGGGGQPKYYTSYPRLHNKIGNHLSYGRCC